jgi:hypothetical protein
MEKDTDIVAVAREIVNLIQPLGELEQKAALEIADTLRAYKSATVAQAQYREASLPLVRDAAV